MAVKGKKTTGNKKVPITKKGPRVWVVVITYENLMSAEDHGRVIPYYEETIYCPSPVSLLRKVQHSIISTLLADDGFLDFIFDDEGEGEDKFNELIGRAVADGSAVIKSPGKVKTVISVEINDVSAEYVGRATVPGYPTVLAEPNFIELTALRTLLPSVTNSIELNYENDEDDNNTQGIEMIYLRADSILGISEEANFVRRAELDPSKIVSGSVIHTSCPEMRVVRVLESPTVVLCRLRSVEFERAEIRASEGAK